MNVFGRKLAVVLGVGLLQAACAEAPDGSEAALSQHRAALGDIDPSGSTGTNGLPPPEYHPNESAIDLALDVPLFDPGTPVVLNDGDPSPLNPSVLAAFSLGGAHALQYVLKCGLPEGFSANFLGKSYGAGVLSTTANWATGALDFGTKADLFACMAVHLNASGDEVPIRLVGASVANRPPSGPYADSKFTFQEALWRALPGTAGASPTTYDVWPLPDLYGNCGKKLTSDSLKIRVCGRVDEYCGLAVHDNIMTACKKGINGWTCGGLPVIKSLLRTDDVPKLYRGCRVRELQQLVAARLPPARPRSTRELRARRAALRPARRAAAASALGRPRRPPGGG